MVLIKGSMLSSPSAACSYLTKKKPNNPGAALDEKFLL